MLKEGDRVMVLTKYMGGAPIGFCMTFDEHEERWLLQMEQGPKWTRYVPVGVLAQLPYPKAV